MDPMQSPAGAPAPQAQKSGMPGWLKCCLIAGCVAVLGVGGFLALSGYMMSKAFMLDPVKVNAVARDIVPCDPPPGYNGFMGMNMAGVKMAMIGPEGMMSGKYPGGPPLMIMLMAMPQKDKAALKMQADMQMAKQGHRVNADKTETVMLKIRGKDVEAQKMISNDGQLMYAIILEQEPTATNSSGQEIIMIMGRQEGFDQKAMDAFISSIK